MRLNQLARQPPGPPKSNVDRWCRRVVAGRPEPPMLSTGGCSFTG